MAILDSKHVSFGGWSLDANLYDDAGLVLSQVSHAGFSFATDMRLVKIWASNSSPATPNGMTNWYLLGSTDCPAIAPSIQEVPSHAENLIRPFIPSRELKCAFRTKGPVIGGDTLPLAIEQSYTFTDYSRNPMHEPGGIIAAARCYPLVRFSYPGGKKDSPTLRYLRFDYRFDISIDPSLQVATKGKVPLVDQAGVFLDTEAQLVPNIQSIFARAEKPVGRELIGQGLQYGLRSDWDNIHQWGTQDPLPATPGAFHAAHTHWRWGASSATGQSFPRPPLPGAPHFAGLGGPGGPLIDPRIPHQSIRFAITGSGTDRAGKVPQWSPANHPSTPAFDDLFTSGRNPADIKDGAVLTQWLSFEVERDANESSSNGPWEGAVFVHGYFFAHEYEDLLLLGPVAGTLAQPIGGLKNALVKEDGVVEKNGWVRK